MSSNITAWPTGVRYRYLNIVGATVDVIRTDTGCEGLCRGCDAHERYQGSADTVDWSLKRRIQPWAQTHSETCRALPYPPADNSAQGRN
ncbi:hypothetical protein [Streptomyces sp. NPDC017988]|uniref:hypothetical protein n=1 Tax=Streptomyces sp. NPDC017988 TaxID=3365025 RepID=UPI003798D2C2